MPNIAARYNEVDLRPILLRYESIFISGDASGTFYGTRNGKVWLMKPGIMTAKHSELQLSLKYYAPQRKDTTGTT